MASLRKRVKRLGRKALKVHSKVQKIVRPIGTAAATMLGGPALGAAFAGATHYAQQYAAASGARADGIKGAAARKYGRSQAQRTTKYSAVALGGATAANLLIGGLGAGAFGLGGQSILGAGSGAGAFGLSNPFMATAAGAEAIGAGTVAAGGLAGAQTWSSLTTKGGAPAQPVEGGAFAWEDLMEGIGGSMAGSPGGGDEGADGSYPVGSLNAMGGGQEPGGMSTGALLALGLGAALLLTA